MERDSRRGKGQWKGCHTFRDIITDDPSKTRNGGLKMGNTYYYYYEVDGSTETFDKMMPTTTTCPYLPGQTVNTLSIPSQKSLRQRSASMNSMRITDFQAIDPQAKFIPPRPAPSVHSETSETRKRTAPGFLRHAASSRSISPTPAWRRLFSSHKNHSTERGRSRDRSLEADNASVTSSINEGNRSATSSRSRNRSISPESLRRFLSDDVPSRPGSNLSDRPPALVIPEDIAEECEENEDDDNFATSAMSETQPYFTGLSPPPFQRSVSSEMTPLTTKNLSSLTINTERPVTKQHLIHEETSSGEGIPILDTNSDPQSSTLTSATSSVLASPQSATPPNLETFTFYDDSNDDEDIQSSKEDGGRPSPALPQSGFIGYALPHQSEDPAMFGRRGTLGKLEVPQFVTAPAASSFSGIPHYLPTPIDAGVDKFALEFDWMVDSIGN